MPIFAAPPRGTAILTSRGHLRTVASGCERQHFALSQKTAPGTVLLFSTSPALVKPNLLVFEHHMHPLGDHPILPDAGTQPGTRDAYFSSN